MKHTGRCLYLFSSDQSHLYTQDILNVLGAPRGHHYTFRYEDKYVDPALRSEWAKLQDTEVVILFSLQQRARYQQPAFIPIRCGWVLRTHRLGSSYFVTFRLGGYVSLPEPSDQENEEIDSQVRKFTERLAALTSVPYASSASIGRPLPSGIVDTQTDPNVLFQRIARYLSHTSAFESASFVRMLGIKPAGEAEYLENYATHPAYKLQAGKTYDLGLYYTQPTAPSQPRHFTVSVDEAAVRMIGRGDFVVESRYDEVLVRLVADSGDGLENRSTVIVIGPGGEVQGLKLEVDVYVQAPRGRTVGIAGLQAIALIAVALAGVLTGIPLAFRILLAVIGALAAVALGLFGANTLKPPSLPSGAPRPPQTTAH